MQVVSPSALPSSPSSSAPPSRSKIQLTPKIIQEMFGEFGELGLIDRYESATVSVGYEPRSGDVYGPVGKHDVGCVEVVDVGQGSSVVIYARGAATGECFCVF